MKFILNVVITLVAFYYLLYKVHSYNFMVYLGNDREFVKVVCKLQVFCRIKSVEKNCVHIKFGINEQKPSYKQDLYQELFFKGNILFIHNILIVCISVLLPVIAMLKDSDLLSEGILVAEKSIFGVCTCLCKIEEVKAAFCSYKLRLLLIMF